MQKHELCSATTRTPPSESTHRELSFEWSHIYISLDSSGFRSFLGLVKFTFGSEKVTQTFKKFAPSFRLLCLVNKPIPFSGEIYRTTESYTATMQDELSFDIGVHLQVVEKSNDGWWKAL